MLPTSTSPNSTASSSSPALVRAPIQKNSQLMRPSLRRATSSAHHLAVSLTRNGGGAMGEVNFSRNVCATIGAAYNRDRVTRMAIIFIKRFVPISCDLLNPAKPMGAQWS